MDHKYGHDLNGFVSQITPSYPPFSSGLTLTPTPGHTITSLYSMASVPPPKDAPNAYDEAERGTQDSHSIHSGPTTVSAPGSIDEKVVEEIVKPPVVISSDVVPVSKATPSKPPAKVSRWILWTLWFNTYRSVSMSAGLLAVFLILLPVPLTRKLFTFVVTLNMVGLVLAASGHFPYALRWTSAIALGNLNFAILMRNELFGRFLYLFVNTCFAKVVISIF